MKRRILSRIIVQQLLIPVRSPLITAYHNRSHTCRCSRGTSLRCGATSTRRSILVNESSAQRRMGNKSRRVEKRWEWAGENKTEANNIQASAWERASIYLLASIMRVHTLPIWTAYRFRRRPKRNGSGCSVVEQGVPWLWRWRRKRKRKMKCWKPTRSSVDRKRRTIGIAAACSQPGTIILIMMILTVILMQTKKYVINNSIPSTLILSSKNT